MTMPQFRSGSEALTEAVDAQKSLSGPRTNYFSIKEDQGTELVRFIMEHTAYPPGSEWEGCATIIVDQHMYVPTRDKPADWPEGSNWPRSMPAVCRKDPAFAGMEGFDGTCYICDFVKKKDRGVEKPHAPTPRGWSLACLREKVLENGQTVGVRDKTEEIAKLGDDGKPIEGQVEVAKKLVIVNQAEGNFFTTLEGFGKYKGTILDRDFFIRRKGTDQSTDYDIIPEDPIQSSDGTIFDLRNPEHLKRYGFANPAEVRDHVAKVVMERASAEYYALFFDIRVPQPPIKQKGDSGGEQASVAQHNPDAGVNDEKLASLASRVRGYGGQGESPQEAQEAPAEATSGGGMRDFG